MTGVQTCALPISSQGLFHSYVVRYDNVEDAIQKIDKEKQPVLFFPNPATDVLNFTEDVLNVSVMDLSGKKVLEASSGMRTLDLTSLVKGVYIVRIHTENGIAVQKLFVNK